MAMIVLDRQHIGKPNNPSDLGAYSELTQEYEAHMVGQYLLETEWTLRRLGHRVVVLSDGYYGHRHKRANNFFEKEGGACIYLAGHLNAGGGEYAALFYDHRSTMGATAAQFIGAQLAKLEGLDSTKSIEARPGDWTSNAFNTIDGIYAGRGCGICLEPFFIDAKKHRHLMSDDGLELVGTAVALGIDAWISSSKRG
jgi:hypothetical protein